jgi:hypothetical protein
MDAGAPDELVRMVYLDEAGTSAEAEYLTVAGVIVHGDDQYRDIDQRVVALIDKYIQREDRPGFVFHATDIFHGSRYFDRKQPQWASREQRWQILTDLAKIISDFKLPIVLGLKEKRWQGQTSHEVMHLHAALECLYGVDLWLNAFAPNELATVVHEDGANAKPVIRKAVRALRSPETLTPESADFFTRAYGLPFDHIIDTVHFAEKGDARLLQLADLSTFMINRFIQRRSVCPPVIDVVREATAWAEGLIPTPQLPFAEEAWWS